MSRTLLLAAAVVFLVPGVHFAQAPTTVKIAGVVGGSKLAVTATNNGGKFTGGGTLTAANGQSYKLTVQSGAILQGHYVRLQGVITAGTSSINFTLYGDRNTGGILFTYVGASGVLIKQSTTGTVVFQ